MAAQAQYYRQRLGASMPAISRMPTPLPRVVCWSYQMNAEDGTPCAVSGFPQRIATHWTPYTDWINFRGDEWKWTCYPGFQLGSWDQNPVHRLVYSLLARLAFKQEMPECGYLMVHQFSRGSIEALRLDKIQPQLPRSLLNHIGTFLSSKISQSRPIRF